MSGFGSFLTSILAAIQQFFTDGIFAWITQLLTGVFPTA
jgi:hypothetical protein